MPLKRIFAAMVHTDIQVVLKNQVTDESFTQGMVDDPLLLMLCEKTRIVYALVDRQRQKAVLLREYHSNNEADPAADYQNGFFNAIIAEDEVLKSLNHPKVILATYSHQHSLVPDPLFSKEHLREILGLTCRIADNARLFEDSIPSASSHMIYSVSQELLKETGDHFHEASVFHASSAFIESQMRLNKHEDQAQVSVLVRQHYFDIVVTQGGELRFFNIFRYESTEDFIYFLLYALEQLQLNPDQVPVRCYGEIEKVSSNWMVGRKYIRNISFGEKMEGLNYSYGFERFSPHQFYNLFNQYLCV